MTQGERVKMLRKELSLTLVEFGERIGVGKSAISNIENNRQNISDQMVKSICREYSVNYDWLVYGKGEMFSEVKDAVLDEICAQYGLDDLGRQILVSYLTLEPKTREALLEHIKKMFPQSNDDHQPDQSKDGN